MGVFSQYLETLKGIDDIHAERINQIKRIEEIRKRDVLTIASDLSGNPGYIGIDYTDLLPVSDQLENLSGEAIDVILETPGGLAERAEDIVDMIRHKYKNVAFIVPGAAMSAGTIMVMAGDEILLGPNSSLGPIDAQVVSGNKRFSADAFIDGFNKIKKEVADTNQLNRAYIPILQGISPAEIQACENAQNFARTLVTEWLAEWKFQNWEIHSSTGKKVTKEDKENRAGEIADQLCKHSRWLTHNRSIKMDDLVEMKLKITDYSQTPGLYDAIRRYYTLLRMAFENSSIFKIYETPKTRIYRAISGMQRQFEIAEIGFTCPQCRKTFKIQVNLGQKAPLKPGNLPFPANNKFKCPSCGQISDLEQHRRKIEAQSKKKIVC
jgi:hypothetical protein